MRLRPGDLSVANAIVRGEEVGLRKRSWECRRQALVSSEVECALLRYSAQRPKLALGGPRDWEPARFSHFTGVADKRWL